MRRQKLLHDSLELLLADFGGLAALALREGLSNAEDDLETSVESRAGLEGNDFASFVEDGAAVGVAEDNIGDASVLELGRADLAGIRATLLVERILGRNQDLLAGYSIATGDEIERRNANDDICSGRVIVSLGPKSDEMCDVPVVGSRSALFKTSTSSLALLSEVGLSFQFPPTKN